MKSIFKLISLVGLAFTIFPSFMVFQGNLGLQESKNLMLIGTLCWFFTAPFWLGRKPSEKYSDP